MLIDISEVLIHEGKIVDIQLEPELMFLYHNGQKIQLIKKSSVHLILKNLSKNKFILEGDVLASAVIPCDRCLTEVVYDFSINIKKEIDLNIKESKEYSFIIQNNLDVNELVSSEIIPEIPMKILCDENCKGICSKCGTDLNQKNCGCDGFVPDPRMAKILDVFSENKEV